MDATQSLTTTDRVSEAAKAGAESERAKLRFTVTGLLVMVAVVAALLGILRAFGICVFSLAILIVIAGSFCFVRHRIARRVFGGLGVLLVGGWVAAFFLASFDTERHGPYVTWYNHRCQALATEAGLVGRPEQDVQRVLGRATYVDEGWDTWVMDTGEPAPGAKYRRTYNYAPYPFLPFAKFQVHCRDGIVESLEMFDD